MNHKNMYNQPPMGQPMMPSPMPRLRGRDTWQQRMMSGNTGRPLTLQQERVLPNWMTGKSIVLFFVAMAACYMVYGYMPELSAILIASISVLLFFFGGESMSKSLSRTKEKGFIRNIFVAGLIVRIIWILYMYFVYNPEHYGNTFGDAADVEWYMPFGKAIAEWVQNRNGMTFRRLTMLWGGASDDWGYPIWLGIIYLIFGKENDVFIPLLLKAVMSAYCAVAIYHVAKRHYGDNVARIAAIFMCFNPNMIYWTSTMMKETEMVFLVCLAVDNFDRVLTSGQRFTFQNLLPGVLASAALLFFRSVLGIVVVLAVFAHIVMASNRVMSFGKKILAGLLVVATLGVAMGDRIMTQSEELFRSARSSERQEQNLSFRANRKGGNSFAKYAGAAVFAPLIFTIPFPTFNTANETQTFQIQLSGGSYIKNILSFFVIWVMFVMLLSGEWRRHVFILAYTVGYHVVLVMSSFAQSGRFHMPVIPMLMLFAAYGIQIAKTNPRMKRLFPIVLMFEVVICLAWNWFKLKGRGMI